MTFEPIKPKPKTEETTDRDMQEKGHKMLKSGAARLAEEAERMAAIKAAASIPDECGFRIAPSPARGGFVLVRNIELLPVGTDKVEAVHRGHGGRAAIRRADVFDAMVVAAKRRGAVPPLTPGQIAMGRRYHDLVELLSADGTKLSSLDASFGGGSGIDWMDRRLAVSDEVAAMRRRIGLGPAMVLRRIRPSQRNRALKPGERAPLIFTRRDLADAVCLQGRSIKQVLAMFGWTDSGRNCKAAMEALAEVLDAMIGYQGRKSS